MNLEDKKKERREKSQGLGPSSAENPFPISLDYVFKKGKRPRQGAQLP